MDQSKQLLLIHGKPLLQKAVEELIAANTGEVIVVLGANAESHKKIITGYPVRIVRNDHWQNGMGSSIKIGLRLIQDQIPKSEAVIISVCDQPHLTRAHIVEIAHAYLKNKKSIVASAYKETLGVPILFDKSHFESLAKIHDQEGAKKILQQNLTDVASVPFPLGAIDLDTKEDYDTFNQ